MAVGRVKWFDDKRGWGFVKHHTGEDVFVHYSNIASEGYKTLADGEEVEYEVRRGDKGLQAYNVMRLNPAAVATAPAAAAEEVPSLKQQEGAF